MAVPLPPTSTTVPKTNAELVQRFTQLDNAVADIQAKQESFLGSLASLESSIQDLTTMVQLRTDRVETLFQQHAASNARAITEVEEATATIEDLKMQLSMVITGIKLEQNQAIQSLTSSLTGEMTAVRDRVEALYGQGETLEIKRGQLEAVLLEKVEAFSPTPVEPEPVPLEPSPAIVEPAPIEPIPEVPVEVPTETVVVEPTNEVLNGR